MLFIWCVDWWVCGACNVFGFTLLWLVIYFVWFITLVCLVNSDGLYAFVIVVLLIGLTRVWSLLLPVACFDSCVFVLVCVDLLGLV